jgi:hypothetical protein
MQFPVGSPVVSLFEGHSLVDQNDLTFLEKQEVGGGIGFLILLFCAVLLLYIHRNSEGFISSVFKASFDKNLASQDARVENTQRSRSLMLVQLVSILSIALFSSTVYLSLVAAVLDPFVAFLWAIGIILNLLISKRLIQWLLAQIFDLQSEMRFHRFSGNILLAIAGIALLPISILLIYSPQIPAVLVTVLGTVVLVFFYLKGLIRGFQLTKLERATSPLFLFYYFCALELLPVFVLIRVANSL